MGSPPATGRTSRRSGDSARGTGSSPASPRDRRRAGPSAPTPVGRDRVVGENEEILAYFAPEAAEHLETMTRALLALERSGRDEEELQSLFRAVHTLKGAAYTVGFTPVGDLAHRLEDLLVAVREARQPLTPAVVEAAFVGVDALRGLVGVGGAPPAEAERRRRARERPDRGADDAASRSRRPRRRLGSRRWPRAPRRPASAARAAAGPFIRVSLDRLDVVMNQVGELVIARSRLDRRLRELDRVGELLQFSRTRMAQAVRDFEAGRAAGGGLSPGPALRGRGPRSRRTGRRGPSPTSSPSWSSTATTTSTSSRAAWPSCRPTWARSRPRSAASSAASGTTPPRSSGSPGACAPRSPGPAWCAWAGSSPASPGRCARPRGPPGRWSPSKSTANRSSWTTA